MWSKGAESDKLIEWSILESPAAEANVEVAYRMCRVRCDLEALLYRSVGGAKDAETDHNARSIGLARSHGGESRAGMATRAGGFNKRPDGVPY